MQKTEMFVLGTVVVVLGVISGFLLLHARAQLRDVTRIAHMRELQIGLDVFYMQQGFYPRAEEALPLGHVTTACLRAEGFSEPCTSESDAFLSFVPQTPSAGMRQKITCGGISPAYCYSADGETFRIQFELENAYERLGLDKGLNCLTETGFASGVCPAYAVQEAETPEESL